MRKWNKGNKINTRSNTPEYTPAITIVGLCEGADIGVGADIAFDGREGEGDWADLGK